MDNLPMSEIRWPEKQHVEEALRSIAGTRCRLTGIVTLSKRSLLLETVTPGGKMRFVAYKQRSNDLLFNLPLSEEHALLSYLAEQLPGGSVVTP